MLNKFKLTISENDNKAKTKIVKSKVSGIITKMNDEFKVVINGIIYDLTTQSFSCIGHLIIYPINYEYNKTRIIRLSDETNNNPFYVPFKIGSNVIGNIVSIDGVEQFNIKKVINE